MALSDRDLQIEMTREIRNIKSIQIFNTVSDVKSITQAADILSISQSSVSYHIKKLETSLGVPLFDRTARGLGMTQEGMLLAAHVERGLHEIQTGLNRVEAMTGSVRVALLPIFQPLVVSASRAVAGEIPGLTNLDSKSQQPICKNE